MIAEGVALVNLDQEVEGEIGSENIQNMIRFVEAVATHSQERQMEAHLLLVGGMVRPDKRGFPHKDIDLVLYAPDLFTEFFKGGDCLGFDNFASFVENVGENLGWKTERVRPWFTDYENRGDGKMILFPEGKPIEVLPVRQSRLFDSFEGYLKSEERPYVVLF